MRRIHKKGEIHIVREGVESGEFYRSRMHIECEALTKEWDELDWENHNSWEFLEGKTEILNNFEL